MYWDEDFKERVRLCIRERILERMQLGGWERREFYRGSE